MAKRAVKQTKRPSTRKTADTRGLPGNPKGGAKGKAKARKTGR